MAEFERLYSDKNEEFLQLQRQFDEFQSQSEEFEQELELEKQALEKELIQAETKLEATEKKVQRLDDELAVERQKKSNSNTAQSSLQNELNQLKGQNKAYAGKIRKLEQENDEFQSKIRVGQGECDRLTRKLEDQIEEVVFLKDELDEVKRSGEEAKERDRTERNNLVDEIERLKNKLASSTKNAGKAMARKSMTRRRSSTGEARGGVSAIREQFEEKAIEEGEDAEDDIFLAREDDEGHSQDNEGEGMTKVELKEEVDELSAAVDEMSEEMGVLTDELQEKSNEINTLKASLENANEKLKALEQGTADGSDGVNTPPVATEQASEEVQANASNLANQMSDLRQRLSEKEEELSLYISNSNQLENELDKMKEEFSEKESGYQDKLIALNDKLEKLEVNFAKEAKEKEGATQTIEMYTAEVEKQKGAAAGFEETIRRMNAENETLKGDVGSFSERVSAMEREKSETDAACGKLREDLATWKLRTKEMQKSMQASIDEERKASLEQKTSLESTVKGLQTAIEAEKQRCESKTKECNGKDNKIQNLNGMLDSLKLEGNKQLESIKMKDSELGVLKDTLMQKEDQLDRFRSEHERIGREVEASHGSIGAELQSKNAEIKKLQAQALGLEQSLQEAKAAFDALNGKAAESDEATEKLKREHASQKNNIETISAAHAHQLDDLRETLKANHEEELRKHARERNKLAASLNDKISALKQDNTALTNEKDEDKELIAQLYSELANVEAEKKQLTESKDKQEDVLNLKHVELSTLSERIADLTKQLSEAHEQAHDGYHATQLMENTRQENGQLKATISDLEKEVTLLSDSHQNARQLQSELRMAHISKQKEVETKERYEEEMKALKGNLEVLSTNKDSLLKSMEEKSAEFMNVIGTLEKELSEEKKTVAFLQEENAVLRDTRVSMSKPSDEAPRTVAEETIKELKKVILVKDVEIDSLASNQRETYIELDAMNKECEKLFNINGNLEKVITNKQNIVQDLQRKLFLAQNAEKVLSPKQAANQLSVERGAYATAEDKASTPPNSKKGNFAATRNNHTSPRSKRSPNYVEDTLRNKIRKTESENARLRSKELEHREVAAMLVAVTEEHNQTKRKLIAAKKTLDAAANKAGKRRSPHKALGASEVVDLRKTNETLKTNNLVLNVEVKRLRHKLNEMKQSLGTPVKRRPKKNTKAPGSSVASRLRTRKQRAVEGFN